jgi:hypothetical protein
MNILLRLTESHKVEQAKLSITNEKTQPLQERPYNVVSFKSSDLFTQVYVAPEHGTQQCT